MEVFIIANWILSQLCINENIIVIAELTVLHKTDDSAILYIKTKPEPVVLQKGREFMLHQ